MKNAGTYKIKISFKGNYSGTKTLTYTIKPASTSKYKITLSNSNYSYNGKSIKPPVTVKNSNGKKISSSNYTVSYSSGRKNVGKYKVTIKFKGNYSGSKSLYFTITPPKTEISKITASKNSLKINFSKKTSQTNGYQIQYATNKSFKSAKTKVINSNKQSSYTIKGLKTNNYYCLLL